MVIPRRRIFAVVATACTIIIMSVPAAPAAAQQQLGAIQGTVTDQTHAVLPGVTVTVTNLATGVSRATTTNETGVYRVPSLDPGRYSVKAELQGFRANTQTDLTLSDGASINNGPWGGTMILVPNVEAVQEFQVIANNPSAEYGRNSGAMVSVITKGGTNIFSGSAFEFHRDQGLRAKGFFETAKAPFR